MPERLTLAEFHAIIAAAIAASYPSLTAEEEAALGSLPPGRYAWGHNKGCPVNVAGLRPLARSLAGARGFKRCFDEAMGARTGALRGLAEVFG